jgi:alkylation response protein AidB-like acyl-CoA dehydrogenase
MARRMDELHGRHPEVGANISCLGFRALAELLEISRIQRLTRHQHILFRLGELIAYAECAGSLAKRAARAADGSLNEKAHSRFDAKALAGISRIFAREAAMKLAADGAAWIAGAGGVQAGEIPDFEKRLGTTAIYRAQAGLIQDMDHIADVLYGRLNRKDL